LITSSFNAETHERAATLAQAAQASAGEGISIAGVHKSFGSTKALRGVNFSARMGEIHAIVGGNGCGKSTLAKVISGVVPADAGQVSVMGKSPAAPHEARAAGIATVFQEVLVADECTVVENLYLGSDGLWSRSLGSAEKYAVAKNLMHELTGVVVDPDMQVGMLPLGVKQWITIGRALLYKPRVLILDESSAALDLDSTERLFGKMRELRDAGGTVIIVTHRIAELIRICDRATVLRDGQDVGVLEKSEITEKNLLRLMTGKNEEAVVASSKPVAARLGQVVLKTEGLKVWPQSAPVFSAVRQGEILGVAGLDGQGQSEFVRILAGVDLAASATPLVRTSHGEFDPILGLEEAVALGVSYVSGDRKREGIFSNLSIFENLLMPLYRRKSRGGKAAIIDWGSLDSTFDREVERLAIRMGERTNKITSLSGGNQQKVLIGRAFAMNPNILVLNDPARGIDVGAKAELYRHLRDFAAAGKSVVYMSSEIEEFTGFCSRVVVFRNGSIFDEFSGDEIHPALILEAMFGQIRQGQVRSRQADFEDEEREVMKILEFDADDNTAGRSDQDNWKFSTSAYPLVNRSSPTEADRAERSKNASLSVQAAVNSAVEQNQAFRSANAPRTRSSIKIMEFNGSSGATTRPEVRIESPAPAEAPHVSPAKGPIKIIEFDTDATLKSTNSRAAASVPGIKILDFDALSKQSAK